MKSFRAKYNLKILVFSSAIIFFSYFLFSQEQDSFEKDIGGPILEQSTEEKKDVDQQIPPAVTPGTPMKTESTQTEAPLYEEAEAISPLDRKIGPIRLKGAPLTTFLDVISAQSKVNFIVSDDVGVKTITVFLRKTTVREALEILLRVKGLIYQRIGKSNTYIIMRRMAKEANLITKVYTLNYIPLIPLASPGQEKDAITSQDVSGSIVGALTQNMANQQGGHNQQRDKNEESNVAIINIIKSVLSKNYGKIATDPRTNSIIVTDIPEVFPQVEQIISELDKKAPQILIEARIIEINTDRLNELGIEWGGSRGELAYFAGPARLTDYGLRPGFFTGDNWKYFYPGPSQFSLSSSNSGSSSSSDGSTTGGTSNTGSSSSGGSSGGSGGIDPIFSTNQQGSRGIYYGIFSLAQLQAIFRALISRGEARYLGTPKIVAMNNKTAVIQISRDSAVGTQSVVTSAGGSAGASSTGVERRRTGLTLQVTPQVNKEGYITLVIQPSYSDTTSSAVTMQGQTVLDPISRGASTMVRVKDGQTVVIGGMLSSTEQKTVKKVPLLGYIPVIGWLFTSTSNRRTNTDLVIFVTPTILVD